MENEAMKAKYLEWVILRIGKHHGVDPISNADKDTTAVNGGDQEQVGGYEGCRRDYSSTVRPFTDRILYLLLSLICQAPPPDLTDECDVLDFANDGVFTH